jgi:hypothetical protein
MFNRLRSSSNLIELTTLNVYGGQKKVTKKLRGETRKSILHAGALK